LCVYIQAKISNSLGFWPVVRLGAEKASSARIRPRGSPWRLRIREGPKDDLRD